MFGDSMSLVEQYIKDLDWEVRENANMRRSFTHLITYLGTKVLKDYTPKVFGEKAWKLHCDGWIHIHKLPFSLLIPYCFGINTAKLLLLGLPTETVASNPAKHLISACDHIKSLTVIISQEFSGATALSAIDLYLAPLLAEDMKFIGDGRVLEWYVKQALEELTWDINYPYRYGYQSPFVNLFINYTSSKKILDEPAIVGGKVLENTRLGDYLDYAEKLIKVYCRLLLHGDAWGRPFTFPILSIFPTKEIMESPIWEDIALLTAKRGTFYFLNPNVVNPDDMFSMCCRLTINHAKVAVRCRGMWTIPDETGSIGVVTINMARIGMEAVKRGDEKYIYDLLLELLGECRKILTIMRNRYYVTMNELDMMPLAKKLGVRLENFYSTVGLVALPEFVSVVLQRPRLWYIEDRGVAKEVVKIYRDVLTFVNKVLDEWEREDNVLYNVEQVPAESASYRLAVLDYEKYPEFRSYIPVEVPMYGSEKVPFYSSQNTPSYSTWDLRLQLEIESEVQPLFTGGVMKHIFLGRELSVDEVTKFVRHITENTKIVYFSLTPVQTTCNDCGFWTTGMYTRCPKCGSAKVDIWSRIVGYYRPVRMWNIGRRAEFRTRQHYMNIPI
ncbi:MAG: anaerobic ribonucleoside-triphosphate reductase [Thermoprotei archaeon]|nr:MAG: anaerobic ribonucleoside-triphosphate reductase [Thermoprotei archaeon]